VLRKYLLFYSSLSYYSLSPLKDFNGLIFGIGFGAHYRFGQDPDAPSAATRSIKFEGVLIPPAFSAMQSYYPKNPLGSVTLTNTEKNPISDIEVSFYQAGYMDSPTPSGSIEELGAGERREAVFITPADSALRNYASFIRQASKEEVIPSYCEAVQFGIQRYSLGFRCITRWGRLGVCTRWIRPHPLRRCRVIRWWWTRSVCRDG